jgi:HK97 family phage major capsid protein
MTAHVSNRALARGVVALRADASDPNKILAELKASFETFKAENDKKLADVVHTEKVDRINADLGKMQAALDAMAAKAAAAEINGAGRTIRDPEHSKAFNEYFRKGSEINASLKKAPDTDGGYLAPVEWDRTILDKLVEISPMRQICGQITIPGTSFKKLFNQKGTVSGWVGETAARPETATPTLGQMQFDTGEIYANPAISQQMLDDAEVDIERWLSNEVEQEFAYQEGLAFVNGTGVNRPNGILTYVTGGTNAAANPYGAITTVNSGAAVTVTGDGLVNLVQALPTAYRGNARFAFNRSTEGAIRKLKDGQGNYLWQPSFQAGSPATLLNYPITEIPALPDLAAASKSVLFGDFRRSYLIIDRKGLAVLRDPYTNKPFVMFYTTKRVGGAVVDPQPMRALNTAV